MFQHHPTDSITGWCRSCWLILWIPLPSVIIPTFVLVSCLVCEFRAWSPFGDFYTQTETNDQVYFLLFSTSVTCSAVRAQSEDPERTSKEALGRNRPELNWGSVHSRQGPLCVCVCVCVCVCGGNCFELEKRETSMLFSELSYFQHMIVPSASVHAF